VDRQAAIDLILDHYENPRHYGALDSPTFAADGVNAGCGDVIRLTVRLDADDNVAAIAFEGEGCTFSQAGASVLAELAHGRPLDDLLAMDESALAEVMGCDVVKARLPCVSLGLRVLKSGAQSHRENGGAPESA
jgi:nitrogen fixation NifU-like protein